MKRILAVLLAVMLFVAVIPATSLAAGAVSNGDTKVYHVQTNGSHLMMRYNAGLKYGVKTSLPNGTALMKVSSSTKRRDGYTWINVKTMGGTTGWVASKYVKNYARADVDTEETGLNVRSSRSTKSSKNILYSIPHDAEGVTVYKINGKWAYVSWRGKKKGWAYRTYLTWSLW